MSTDRKLAELLDVATTDVPAGHLAPPIAAIHGRVRRRRRMFVAATAAAVTVVLAGGYSVSRVMLADPAPPVPIGPAASPTAPSGPAVPWVSAMVARDDTTITVYAGAKRCETLDRPQARIAAQDAAGVTIEVTGRAVPAGDCTTSGNAVPVAVRLPAPLGERKLLDAASTRSHPTYFERYLPDLQPDGTWSPVSGSWQSSDANWYGTYNGPDSTTLALRAQPTESAPRNRVPVSTVDLGPYEAIITGSSAGTWRAWWQAGDVTYSLRIEPREGETLTLTQFKQKLTRLWT